MSENNNTSAESRVRELEQQISNANHSARHAVNELSKVETTFSIAAHIVTADTSRGTFTGRLVLKGEDGFHVVVLAVGDPSPSYGGAITNVLRKFEQKLSGVAS